VFCAADGCTGHGETEPWPFAVDHKLTSLGTVRLFVFGPKGQHMDEGLTQGDGPCQWNWPKMV
jgi:hypothetical protein